MENFNVKFKSKELKDKAWAIAKAVNEKDYRIAVSSLENQSAAAFQWLQNIGLEKLTPQKSTVVRYGILTSNNVESVNNRLRKIRRLPILEMLLEIEKLVLSDRAQRFWTGQSWPLTVTEYAKLTIERRLRGIVGLSFTQTSERDFIVFSTLRQNSEFQVSLANGGSCTCGKFYQFKLPCLHLLFVLRKNRINIDEFIPIVWTKDLYVDAYAQSNGTSTLTVRAELTPETLCPPLATKKRGRPKKNRIQSQIATIEIDTEQRKRSKCSGCQKFGHNKRTCSRQ